MIRVKMANQEIVSITYHFQAQQLAAICLWWDSGSYIPNSITMLTPMCLNIMMIVTKAVHHISTHFNIITTFPISFLKIITAGERKRHC